MKSKNAPTAETSKVLKFLEAYGKLKKLEKTDVSEAADLILQHGFVREHIPTHLLDDKLIWEALLVGMPMAEMIRNLGKMASVGLLTPDEAN
ncbi:unnamed protein product, partial [Gongylonema pulchrum]|uniref:TROVE domain-containing protein n=1 Tax=Gongylonema pulchrum TaxID=637853 RepID=A0A183EYF9_9BILA